MNKTKGRGAPLKSPATTSITLRPDVELLAFYERVTERANRLRISKRERGNLTVQQVILHRLRSLPAYKVFKAGQKSGSESAVDRGTDGEE